MDQPEGFVVKGKEFKVCGLQKAIYGLKQVALQWNKQLHKSLLEMDFTCSLSEPGTYFKIIGQEIIILLVYVDILFVWAATRHKSLFTRSGSCKNKNLIILAKPKNI